MSTIDEIREQSKTVWAVNPLTQAKNDTSTDDEFSNLLEQIKTGAPAGGSGGSSDDTKTRTVTEVGGNYTNQAHYLHTFNDFAKDGMVTIQPRSRS